MVTVLDDSHLTIPTFSPVCSKCTHLKHYGEGRTCKAFKEIPMAIWEGKHRHRKPYRGDGGIQFKLIK